MNAVASSLPGRSFWGDAFAALRACTSRRHQLWTLSICTTLLVASGALAVAVPAGDDRSGLAGGAAALANFTLWSGLIGRLVLLRSQAAAWRMPGVAAATRAAVALGAALTILLPGALLLAAGLAASQAFGIPALGACAGLLFVLMPSPAVLVLCMVPAVVGMIPVEARVFAERAFGSDVFSVSALPLLLALGALAASWAWIRAVRIDNLESVPQWRRPLVMFNPMNALDFGATPTDRTEQGLQTRAGWLAPVSRVDIAGPHDPRAAIGALLGGPMGQVAPREAARQWTLFALTLVAILVIPVRGDAVLLRDALLVGGLVGVLAGGWTLALRLDRQRQRLSGELTELALMPGLGDPQAARKALLESVMRRLGELMLVALAALLLLAWVRDMPWNHINLLLGMMAGVAAGSVLMCLVALAGSGLATVRMGVAMLPLVSMTAATLFVVMQRIPLGGAAAGWGAAWALLTCGYLMSAWRPLQTFRRRAHAFLVD